MKKVIKYNNQEIVAERTGENLSWPCIHDVLQAVGLEIYLSESGKFMEDLYYERFDEIIDWITDCTDIEPAEARLRLTRFIHIVGLAGVITSEQDDMMPWVDWIHNISGFVLNPDKTFTYADLQEMLTRNGIFNESFSDATSAKICRYRDRIVKTVQSHIRKPAMDRE